MAYGAGILYKGWGVDIKDWVMRKGCDRGLRGRVLGLMVRVGWGEEVELGLKGQGVGINGQGRVRRGGFMR